jgi:hypothetical protein
LTIITITTSAAHGLSAGQSVTVAGVGVSGYNGTFPVVSVPSSTQFTYIAGASGLAASGGGTASAAGNVATGVHQVCVIFKTRQGYLTKPSPASSWTASGGKRAVVTNIPTGPSNVVARILCFTGAGGASFFYVGAGATLFSGTMRKPFSLAPFGLAAIATAAGCVAPLGLATTATITFSSTTVGPLPGPLWLTRSKLVSSNIQNAVGVQQQRAQRGVQRLVRFHVVDRGIAGERAEQRLQSGTRGHIAVAVDDVLAIGRDSVREIRGRHVGDEAPEDFDGRVE